MIIVYVLLILLAGLPLFFILKKIFTYRKAQKRGVTTKATVTAIYTTRFLKGLPQDRLTLTYYSLEKAAYASGVAVTVYNKYKVGDQVDIAFTSRKRDLIIPGDIGGFLPVLWFLLALFLFVVFAVIKLSQMAEEGF